MGILNIIENRPKNYCINGSFDFWQRNTSSNINLTNGYSAADRFFGYRTGTWSSTPAWARSAVVPDNKILSYSLNAAGTPSLLTDQFHFRHRIEAVEARELVEDGHLSLSAYFRSANIRDVDIVVNYANAENDFSSVTNIINIATRELALDDLWHREKFEEISLPAAAITGIEILISFTPTILSAFNFWMAGLMINRGKIALPFNRAGNHIQTEYEMCMRFYEKTYDHENPPGSNTQSSSITSGLGENGNKKQGGWRYKVTKRANPSIVCYDVAGNANRNSYFDSNGGLVNNQTVDVNSIGKKACRITPVVQVSARTGLVFHATADAEL